MSIRMLGPHKSDSNIIYFDVGYEAFVVRRFGMRNILYRLLWECLDLAQLAIKDWVAAKENESSPRQKPVSSD